MGSTYTTLVGIPPHPLTPAWRTWYFNLLALRLANCPLARATTYYFAQSGNDTTGNGSIATPYKTIAKAQAIHDAAASTANLALLFKRGDTWEESGGLSISKNNVTVADYGSGAKPLFNKFSVKYSSAGWTLGSGDRYSRTETNDIAWVREVANRLTVAYTQVSSTTLVQSTPLSFYYDSAGTTLHINAGTGVSPNSKNLEAVVSNTVDGVVVSGDGCRVQNIRADGYGINRTNSQTQKYAIGSNCTGTNEVVFVRCEGYFSASHVVAHYAGGGSGGIATFVGCKAGYARYNSVSGESMFNSFSNTGGQETIFHECEATYGCLPDLAWYAAATPREGGGFYAHTGTATISLMIAYRFRDKDNPYGVKSPGSCLNTPAATVITDCRVFDVEHIAEGGVGMQDFYVAPPGIVRMGGSYKLKPAGNIASSGALGTAVQGGWFVNNTVDIDMVNISSVLFMWSGASGHTAEFYFNTFRISNIADTFGFDANVWNGVGGGNTTLQQSSSLVKFKNNVLERDGTFGSHFYLDLSNTYGAAGRINNNAYYGIDVTSNAQGATADAAAITLTDVILPDHRPDPSSLLYRAGDASVYCDIDSISSPRNRRIVSVGPQSDYVAYLSMGLLTLSDLAASVLVNPLNRLTTDSSGNVGANNLPTDYQQRAVAVTLPATPPSGYAAPTDYQQRAVAVTLPATPPSGYAAPTDYQQRGVAVTLPATPPSGYAAPTDYQQRGVAVTLPTTPPGGYAAPTDYQQRGVAVTLPTTPPSGYAAPTDYQQRNVAVTLPAAPPSGYAAPTDYQQRGVAVTLPTTPPGGYAAPTDYQQRGVAVTLPTPPPSGYAPPPKNINVDFGEARGS